MPWKSKAQMKWMYANKPEMADRWAKETPNPKALPNKVSKKKKKRVNPNEFWSKMRPA